ncbi:MAG TPA: Mrp/NBP35 family ATP-binding protein [Longimicrobiaceae bacterium]
MDEANAAGGLTEEEARAALRQVLYPGLRRDIVALGLVRSVTVRDGRVHVSLVLASTQPEVPDRLRAEIRARLAEAGAVRSEVQILAPEQMRQKRDPWAGRGRLPGVGSCIAVGSGKGGVGKSTVAANLALALHGLGHRVGLLDADIYGPSIPMILGLEDGARRVRLTPDRKIQPLEAGGLAVVSFGFFLGPGSPAVWRGPMVSKAVKQFSRGVVWPQLDYLVIDLPPGTGDVPLSLAQSIVVDGAVVVTTPQRLAVQEAEKAVEMFRKLEVPVLGVVENMSHSLCACGRRSHPFGQGGGSALAERIQVPLLAEVPFEEPVGSGADRGVSPVVERPGSAVARELVRAASRIVNALSPAAAFHHGGVHD